MRDTPEITLADILCVLNIQWVAMLVHTLMWVDGLCHACTSICYACKQYKVKKDINLCDSCKCNICLSCTNSPHECIIDITTVDIKVYISSTTIT